MERFERNEAWIEGYRSVMRDQPHQDNHPLWDSYIQGRIDGWIDKRRIREIQEK